LVEGRVCSYARLMMASLKEAEGLKMAFRNLAA